MMICDKRTGLGIKVREGDTFYCYYLDKVGARGRDQWPQARQRVWSFPCCGVMVTDGKHYILGPEGRMYQLGVDCFVTGSEARDAYYDWERQGSGSEDRKRYRMEIHELREEELARL